MRGASLRRKRCLGGWRMQQIDPHGRALVVLRELPNPFGYRYDVQESGILVREGDALSIEHPDGTTRPLSNFEKARLLVVMPTNRIPECAGYQFFILQRDGVGGRPAPGRESGG
jgi:hypothetical protein